MKRKISTIPSDWSEAMCAGVQAVGSIIPEQPLPPKVEESVRRKRNRAIDSEVINDESTRV